MIEGLKSFFEMVISVDAQLGIVKFCEYLILGAFIYFGLNFKKTITNVIELHDQVAKKRHDNKIKLRDQLTQQLNQLLNEFRADLNADRVMYFEYHNSKENLVGIPFKYSDLVITVVKYGSSAAKLANLKEVNTGLIADLYYDLCKNTTVFNKDDSFFKKYPNLDTIINVRPAFACYVNLSGIYQPIGFIIAEWDDPSKALDWDFIDKESKDYGARINALVVSYSNK